MALQSLVIKPKRSKIMQSTLRQLLPGHLGPKKRLEMSQQGLLGFVTSGGSDNAPQATIPLNLLSLVSASSSLSSSPPPTQNMPNANLGQPSESDRKHLSSPTSEPTPKMNPQSEDRWQASGQNEVALAGQTAAIAAVNAFEGNRAALGALAGLVPALAGARQSITPQLSAATHGEQVARQMAALLGLNSDPHQSVTQASQQNTTIPLMSLISSTGANASNGPSQSMSFNNQLSSLASLGINLGTNGFSPQGACFPPGMAQSQPQKIPPVQTPPVSASPSTASMSNTLFSNMQNWSLEQLEQHVALLRQLNQPIPQNVSILLGEMRRKEDKRAAKRIANRKSASTSRARKKAFVEDMTKTNARLRRQALILALLPDMVITTTENGVISFCSAQVERTLKHRAKDLVGVKLSELLVPSSRPALQSLFQKVQRQHPRSAVSDSRPTKRSVPDGIREGNENAKKKPKCSSSSDQQKPNDGSATAIVSEQFFPLSVVEVESKRPIAQSRSMDNFMSTTTLSSEEDSSNDIGGEKDKKTKRRSDSTGGNGSSSTMDSNRMQKACENLSRNVRWHNERLNKEVPKDGPKDDVTGASVTKNNATARLSSLKHVPKKQAKKKSSQDESINDQSSSDDSLLAGVEEKKKPENASDDSGYRESNESREETSSSSSVTSNSNDRYRKFAPTCKICLIREDMTSLWCEVASSVRINQADEAAKVDGSSSRQSTPDNLPKDVSRGSSNEKEYLFCLRPIRDGEKVAEPLRISNKIRLSESSNSEEEQLSSLNQSGSTPVSSSSGTGTPPIASTCTKSISASSGNVAGRSSTTTNSQEDSPNATDTERSVVESLILMSNKQTS